MIRNIFYRVRERLSALPIGAMLGLILVLGLVPAFVMGWSYVNRGFADVAIIDKELEGVEVLQELKQIEAFVMAPPADPVQRMAQAKKMEQIVSRIGMRHGHVEILNAKAAFKSMKTSLALVSAGQENVNIAASYNALVTRIGDQSGLILDPVLDSYYLMTIAVNESRKIAKITDELAQHYARTTDMSDPLIVATRRQLADAVRDMRDSTNTAIASSKYTFLAQSNLLKSVDDTIIAANRFISEEGMTNPATREPMDRANNKVWEISTFTLKVLLENRKQETIRNIYLSLSISVSVGAIVILLACLVIMGITGAFGQITRRLRDLSEGDYISEVPGLFYRNDIGVIANALQDFIDLSGKVDEERQQAKFELEKTVMHVRQENEELMAAALEQQARASKQERETLAKLAADLEMQIGSLLLGSQTAAEQMGREATAMASRTGEVNRESGNAAKVAADIHTAFHPVADTVSEVSKNLDAYAILLSEANALALEAASRVKNVNQRVTEFSHATQAAGGLLNTITQVAQKTNMLALNASIEAMRAGEAGQGFQVVAGEVKALASSTHDMASKIGSYIRAMEIANGDVAGAIEGVMGIVDTLSSQSANVASGMNDQTTAMYNVTEIMAKTDTELNKMLASTKTAEQSARVSSALSHDMLMASQGVTDNVGALDSSVRTFLRGIAQSQKKAA